MPSYFCNAVFDLHANRAVHRFDFRSKMSAITGPITGANLKPCPLAGNESTNTFLLQSFTSCSNNQSFCVWFVVLQNDQNLRSTIHLTMKKLPSKQSS